MTRGQQEEIVAAMMGSEFDEFGLVSPYLDIAGEQILTKMYPFGRPEDAEVPVKYQMLQCEIAVYMLNKRGAEGEVTHSENGISRTYEAAGVPPSMLRAVTPYCEVL